MNRNRVFTTGVFLTTLLSANLCLAAEWVEIPAGDFYKGLHAHRITIENKYQIMVNIVTNDQFSVYLNEAVAKGTVKVEKDKVVGHYPGDRFDGYKHEEEIKAGDWPHLAIGEKGGQIQYDGKQFSSEKGYENHPVVNVTWFGAKGFCEYYGWRLPTEIEWEKAARGGLETEDPKRAFPWGNEISHANANYYASKDPFEKKSGKRMGGTTPVGYYNGKTYDDFKTVDSKSPYGLNDMAGNVWQWMGDDKADVHYRYMRGGSMANYDHFLRVWAENSARPDYYGIAVGFRCSQ